MQELQRYVADVGYKGKELAAKGKGEGAVKPAKPMTYSEKKGIQRSGC